MTQRRFTTIRSRFDRLFAQINRPEISDLSSDRRNDVLSEVTLVVVYAGLAVALTISVIMMMKHERPIQNDGLKSIVRGERSFISHVAAQSNGIGSSEDVGGAEVKPFSPEIEILENFNSPTGETGYGPSPVMRW